MKFEYIIPERHIDYMYSKAFAYQIDNFYNKYYDEYFFNPAITTQEEAQEMADYYNHDVYPFPYKDRFDMLDDVYLNFERPVDAYTEELFLFVTKQVDPVHPSMKAKYYHNLCDLSYNLTRAKDQIESIKNYYKKYDYCDSKELQDCESIINKCSDKVFELALKHEKDIWKIFGE